MLVQLNLATPQLVNTTVEMLQQAVVAIEEVSKVVLAANQVASPRMLVVAAAFKAEVVAKAMSRPRVEDKLKPHERCAS